MTATVTTPVLKWVPKSSGKARWYETECGRFSLIKSGDRRFPWTLHDRATPDVCCPQYHKMESVSTIKSGMAKASRWLAGKVW